MCKRNKTSVQISETTANGGTHFLRKKIPRNTAIHRRNIESITVAGYLVAALGCGTFGCRFGERK